MSLLVSAVLPGRCARRRLLLHLILRRPRLSLVLVPAALLRVALVAPQALAVVELSASRDTLESQSDARV